MWGNTDLKLNKFLHFCDFLRGFSVQYSRDVLDGKLFNCFCFSFWSRYSLNTSKQLLQGRREMLGGGRLGERKVLLGFTLLPLLTRHQLPRKDSKLHLATFTERVLTLFSREEVTKVGPHLISEDSSKGIWRPSTLFRLSLLAEQSLPF